MKMAVVKGFIKVARNEKEEIWNIPLKHDAKQSFKSSPLAQPLQKE